MPDPDHSIWYARHIELTEQEADLSEEAFMSVVDDLIRRTREEIVECYTGRHG